jgi:heme-degrading monooxygenase HmoA
MYIHIALYKWKATATAETIRAALDKVKALADKVAGLIEVTWGENSSKYGEGYTHVILVRAENEAAIEAYRNHPDHEKVAKEIEAMEDHGIGVDFTPQ